MDIAALNKLLGNLDIYLLDQILKGRFNKEQRILDAGCGEGRNIIYFLREGFQIFGIDSNPIAIQMARIQAQTIQKDYDIYRFQTALVEDMPFHHGAMDVVISSAVLHFANNTSHFQQMLKEMLRVLRPGGILFLRMTTAVQEILGNATPLGDGLYRLPDGSKRFVLTEKLLAEMMAAHGLRHLEAPKSVLVHGKRAMGVFVMQKADGVDL
ncbi:MAG TPA: class I SAM-dependent methyltransferase [Cyclobacteriaceae bacterium]|nr:class I SAM-dependent methyltransferase [Cyclobacteriaceae bacterium]